MSRRTTPDLVRSICSVDTTLNLYGFIDTASEMTDRVEEAGETNECRLELIERWLAAHLAMSTVSLALTEKQIDITKEKFNIAPAGADLKSTPYGRQALALDRTWTLEKEYGTKVDSLWIGDAEGHDYYG